MLRMLAACLAWCAVACIQSTAVVCPSGVVCPPGWACDERGSCRDPVLVAACEGKLDGEYCTIAQPDDGSCELGACVALVCGNGIVQPNERCDDGNRVDGDGCRSDCESNEACGNTTTDFHVGEQCDCGTDPAALAPGCSAPNSADGGLCRADCRLHCGDGEVRGLETCDGAAPARVYCADFGYDLGNVGCSPVCSVDLGTCQRIGWQPLSTPSNTGIYAMWAVSPQEAFAVGPGGVILHVEGASVTPMASGTTSQLLGVWAASSDDVFVVGSRTQTGGGIVLHYDGTTWSEMTTPVVDGRLLAVWGRAADEVWAVGTSAILHYDGASWTSEPLPADAQAIELRQVTGAGADVYAVGSTLPLDLTTTGKVLRRSTTGWEVMPAPTLPPLNAVWASSSTNIWVGGLHSSIFRFDGAWTETNIDAVQVTEIVGTHPDNVYVTGTVGTFRWDGRVFLKLTSPPEPPDLSSIAIGDAEHLFGFSFGRVYRSSAYHWIPVSFAPESNPPSFTAAYGTSTANIFVLSHDPQGLQHWDGSAWSPITPPPIDLTDIWADSTSLIVAVGIAGLYEFNGSWSSVSTASAPLAVWGAGPQDIIVVGEDGMIIRYTTSWTSMSSSTTETLRDVWGRNGSDIYAVGDNGTIVHYNGTQWTPMVSGTTAHLYGVAGSATSLYAVGDGGTVLRFDGTTWSAMDSGVAAALRSVSVTGDQAFAVGDGATVLYSDGQRLSRVRSPDPAANWTAVFAQPSAALLLAHGGVAQWLLRPLP